jgi:hypothetical protein
MKKKEPKRKSRQGNKHQGGFFSMAGRGGGIRTRDPLLPNLEKNPATKPRNAHTF